MQKNLFHSCAEVLFQSTGQVKEEDPMGRQIQIHLDKGCHSDG